jgi:hypothetical protein
MRVNNGTLDRYILSMSDDPLYSSATSAMLIAMTALLRAEGVSAAAGLERAHTAWRDHIQTRGNDSWEFAELRALVGELTTGPS